MSTLESLLKNGLIAQLTANDTFWVSVGGTAGGTGNGRLRYIKEGAGIARPYVRFSFGPSAQEGAFLKDAPVATEVLVYFDVFSDSGGTLEMENITGYIQTVMNPLSLTLTGYHAMRFRAGPVTASKEDDTGFFHTNMLYRSYANPS